MARKIQGYGWTADLPDGRDLLYAAPIEALERLPRRVDLRKQCPPLYDQGQLGSCTANAIAGVGSTPSRNGGGIREPFPNDPFNGARRVINRNRLDLRVFSKKLLALRESNRMRQGLPHLV